MKRSWAIIVFLAVAAAAQAGQGTVSVGTGSVCVLQAVIDNPGALTAWAVTNTVQNGELRLVGGMPHMCLVGGVTSNTAPTVRGSLDTTDGLVVWRPASGAKRQGVVIGNDGTNALYISFGARAGAVGYGLPAGACMALSGAEAPQTAIHAVRVGGVGDLSLTWW